MKNNFAFSLAETLTTLMLIGVVAAVTIPVLNANVEKQKTIANLKRLYSSFSINIQTVLNEANCSSISCLRAYSNDGIVNQSQNDIVIEKTDEKTGKTFKEREFHQIEGHVFANPKYFNVLTQIGCKEC
ncbi:MAG: type II secretion system GspH family protein, partial [bacterium]|nr:type II secretion system GspH family protein [bacterium]